MEKKISKMYNSDKLIIWAWIVLMWIVLVPVYIKVSSLTESNSVRIAAFIIGGLVGLFNTISVIAVGKHLNKNKIELYTEDIQNNSSTIRGKTWSFSKVFDVLFILILCYVTLLIPILLQGKVLVGAGEGSLQYSVNPLSAGLCILAFVSYMSYMLSNSQKELKSLINNVYGENKETISGKGRSL